MNIDGKIALVTGSAKRIGRAVALELGRRGARVAIHYRSANREAEDVLKIIRHSGGGGGAFRAELTDVAAVEEMFRDLESAFGGLDILVNSASIFSPSTVHQATPD